MVFISKTKKNKKKIFSPLQVSYSDYIETELSQKKKNPSPSSLFESPILISKKKKKKNWILSKP